MDADSQTNSRRGCLKGALKYNPEMVEPAWQEKLRQRMYWVIVLGVTVFCFALGLGLAISGFRGSWHAVTQEHCATVVGLPCAAILALAIVLLLRSVSGEIELTGPGSTFKGAAGPIIMWVICFLAIAVSVWFTWNLKASNSAMRSTQQGPTHDQ